MARKRHNKPPKVPMAEQEQVRIRKRIGHDFAIVRDQFGRERLKQGTAESSREYADKDSDVVRVRRADHLQTMLKSGALTSLQHRAGELYRDDFELVNSHGVRGVQWGERVDTSGYGAGAPLAVSEALIRLRQCAQHAGLMGEFVLKEVCGKNNSPASLAGVGGASREYWSARLRESLEEIGVRVYRIMKDRDRSMVPEAGGRPKPPMS